jgi:flagellar hook-associated protein 2
MASTISTNPPVATVAASSSAAAAGGSVINVSSLVSQLVAASRAGQDAVIAKQTQTVTTKISALGTLKSALSAFQSSLSTLDTSSAFGVETATSSDKSIFTASAGSSAVGGSYSVAVTQLAQSQQLLSNPFVGGSSAVVGTGTLALTLGGTSFNVAVDSSNDTVAGIAAAINSARGNPGITATVVTGTDGAHLVLGSTMTGAANTISVSETDTGTALSALTYGALNTTHYTQNSTPQDAQFSIAGVGYTSASNTVSNAISGVTLTLLGKTAPASSATLTVASDSPTIASNISGFVTAYNALVSAMAPLGSYDATTNSAGPMLGDPVFSGIQNQLRQALYSVVNTGSATANTLAAIGITTNKDGTLSLDSGKLSGALASNFSAVSQLFSGTTGIATTLNTQLTNALGANGLIGSRSQSLVKQENALSGQTNTLNTQMAALTASLTLQYSRLNSLLSSLQTTSAYLTQAFATLPTVQGKANA